MHYYGVDITKVRWFSGAKAGSLPEGVTIEPIPQGQLNDRLVAGELDAVIQADVMPAMHEGNPNVRRLFPDYKTEEQKYFKDTGIFPISHMLTFPQAFVDQHPDAPVAMLKAFREARDEAFHRMEDAQVLSLSWSMAALDEQRALMGHNYWAYNVKDNIKPLESMIQFAEEQALTPKRLSVDMLFVPETAAYPGW